jgi:hypothetical protein
MPSEHIQTGLDFIAEELEFRGDKKSSLMIDRLASFLVRQDSLPQPHTQVTDIDIHKEDWANIKFSDGTEIPVSLDNPFSPKTEADLIATELEKRGEHYLATQLDQLRLAYSKGNIADWFREKREKVTMYTSIVVKMRANPRISNQRILAKLDKIVVDMKRFVDVAQEEINKKERIKGDGSGLDWVKKNLDSMEKMFANYERRFRNAQLENTKIITKTSIKMGGVILLIMGLSATAFYGFYRLLKSKTLRKKIDAFRVKMHKKHGWKPGTKLPLAAKDDAAQLAKTLDSKEALNLLSVVKEQTVTSMKMASSVDVPLVKKDGIEYPTLESETIDSWMGMGDDTGNYTRVNAIGRALSRRRRLQNPAEMKKVEERILERKKIITERQYGGGLAKSASVE